MTHCQNQSYALGFKLFKLHETIFDNSDVQNKIIYCKIILVQNNTKLKASSKLISSGSIKKGAKEYLQCYNDKTSIRKSPFTSLLPFDVTVSEQRPWSMDTMYCSCHFLPAANTFLCWQAFTHIPEPSTTWFKFVLSWFLIAFFSNTNKKDFYHLGLLQTLFHYQFFWKICSW